MWNKILEKANEQITTVKQDQYGKPEDSFGRIASYWSTYLDILVKPEDVTQLMVLLKLAREQSKHKMDNLVDLCGYGALTDRLLQKEEISAKENMIKEPCCSPKKNPEIIKDRIEYLNIDDMKAKLIGDKE